MDADTREKFKSSKAGIQLKVGIVFPLFGKKRCSEKRERWKVLVVVVAEPPLITSAVFVPHGANPTDVPPPSRNNTSTFNIASPFPYFLWEGGSRSNYKLQKSDETPPPENHLT